jgi:tetratricopeptide (TPR) repeat protein
MALAYAGMGNDVDAEKNYVKAISLKPRGIVPYQEAAAYFSQEGKYSLAESTLDQGLKRYPEDILLLINYANLMLQLNKLEQAALALNKAFKLSPDDQMIWTAILVLPDGTDPKLTEQVTKMAIEFSHKNPDSEFTRQFNTQK